MASMGPEGRNEAGRFLQVSDNDDDNHDADDDDDNGDDDDSILVSKIKFNQHCGGFSLCLHYVVFILDLDLNSM